MRFDTLACLLPVVLGFPSHDGRLLRNVLDEKSGPSAGSKIASSSTANSLQSANDKVARVALAGGPLALHRDEKPGSPYQRHEGNATTESTLSTPDKNLAPHGGEKPGSPYQRHEGNVKPALGTNTAPHRFVQNSNAGLLLTDEQITANQEAADVLFDKMHHAEPDEYHHMANSTHDANATYQALMSSTVRGIHNGTIVLTTAPDGRPCGGWTCSGVTLSCDGTAVATYSAAGNCAYTRQVRSGSTWNGARWLADTGTCMACASCGHWTCSGVTLRCDGRAVATYSAAGNCAYTRQVRSGSTWDGALWSQTGSCQSCPVSAPTCSGLDWDEFFPSSLKSVLTSFFMGSSSGFELSDSGGTSSSCTESGTSIHGSTPFRYNVGQSMGQTPPAAVPDLGYHITTLANNGGVIAALYAENDYWASTMPFLGRRLGREKVYLVVYKYYSGYSLQGDQLAVFFQVKVGSFSLSNLVNGLAGNLAGVDSINIDFLPTFTDVTLTACTGRGEANTGDTLDAQFAGLASHEGAEQWPNSGVSPVPMGDTLVVGSATLDFRTKISDGVYLNANADFALQPGPSDFAQMSRAIVCFLPEMLVGTCTTALQLEAFVPRSGDFDTAYFKIVQPAEAFGDQRFITSVGERSIKVIGFGADGIQSAELEAQETRVSFPKAFNFNDANPFSQWEHLAQVHMKAKYAREGVFGTRIQLDIALTDMNWEKPFGINGLNVNTGSVSLILVYGAAQATRNGPSVQMTTQFTLDASNAARMTYEEARQKARKAGILLLGDVDRKAGGSGLKNDTTRKPWKLRYDVGFMKRGGGDDLMRRLSEAAHTKSLPSAPRVDRKRTELVAPQIAHGFNANSTKSLIAHGFNTNSTKSLMSLSDLTDTGVNGCGIAGCGMCEGDCDNDDQCRSGLVCFKRPGTEAVPGCSGTGTNDWDYCVRPLVDTGGGGCGIAGCGECEGDCDNDDQCRSGLVCFKRPGTEAVPGCTGTGINDWDYCVRPTLVDTGGGGCGSAGCGVCEGDCDNDNQCQNGLVCFKRPGTEAVPGCLGTGGNDWDYCVLPAPNPQDSGFAHCTDQNTQCSTLAAQGECQHNPIYMWRYCQASCNYFPMMQITSRHVSVGDHVNLNGIGIHNYIRTYTDSPESRSIHECNTACAITPFCDFTVFRTNSECMLFSRARYEAWFDDGQALSSWAAADDATGDVRAWPSSCPCTVNGFKFCAARRYSGGRLVGEENDCLACPSSRSHCPSVCLARLPGNDYWAQQRRSSCVNDCERRCDPPEWFDNVNYQLSEKSHEHCHEAPPTTGREACFSPDSFTEDECYAQGCCHFDSAAADTCQSILDPDDACTTDLHTSGVQACEGHNLGEASCLAIGCCVWNGFFCRSGVGTKACPGVDFRTQTVACDRVETAEHCGNVGCCSWSHASLVDTNADGCGSAGCGMCEGDCDNDNQCQNGLVCFKRPGTEPVPGCTGTGNNDWDYCIPSYLASNGALVNTNVDGCGSAGCGVCEGDCDNDGDCQNGHVCFKRPGSEPVPGCTGTGNSDWDYCIPSNLASYGALTNTDADGCGSAGCGTCEGDCDDDGDCQNGHVCFKRPGSEPVPGCTGTGNNDWDYCIPSYLDVASCMPEGSGEDICLNPFDANLPASTYRRDNGNGGAFPEPAPEAVSVPDSESHAFAVGLQLPIGDPVKMAANFGVYFRTDSPMTAHDAMKLAQMVAFGELKVGLPEVLKKITIEGFEMCLSPGGPVDFFMPDYQPGASCGPGLAAELNIEVLESTAKFKIDAAMQTNDLGDGTPIALEVELQNLDQLKTKVEDAAIDCVREVIDWQLLTDSIRTYLSAHPLSIDSFKFGFSLQGNGQVSGFALDVGLVVAGNSVSIPVQDVVPFDDMLDLFRQWTNSAFFQAIGFTGFPPFPDGHLCLALIDNICENTCLMSICVPNNAVTNAIAEIQSAAIDVAAEVTAHVAEVAAQVAAEIAAGAMETAGHVGDVIDHLQDGNFGNAFASGAKAAYSGTRAVGQAQGAVGQVQERVVQGIVSETVAPAVCALFGCRRKAYSDLELSVLNHPNATLLYAYILMQGPPLNQTIDARHMHGLLASAYEHSDEEMASAYQVFQPHKQARMTVAAWRMVHAHNLIGHHMKFTHQKRMQN